MARREHDRAAEPDAVIEEDVHAWTQRNVLEAFLQRAVRRRPIAVQIRVAETKIFRRPFGPRPDAQPPVVQFLVDTECRVDRRFCQSLGACLRDEMVQA